MKKALIFSLLITTYTAHAKLVDKTIAIFNDKVITLSEIERIKTNLAARSNISPFIYENTHLTNEEILKLTIHKEIIRSKLEETGIVISDEQVEENINDTQKRLNVSRSGLLQFLTSNSLTYDEYFDITKEAIEYNLFSARIIDPLISITDQEVKNLYFKENANNKTVAYKYNLVDFSIEKSKLSSEQIKGLKKVLQKFQVNGILPDEYSTISSSTLGDITEEGVSNELKTMLKQAEEGSFTEPITLNNEIHVFFVKNKDVTESEKFNAEKPRLREALYKKVSTSVKDVWFSREESKYFIQTLL